MRSETWRAIGRWLSVPPAFAAGLIMAYVGIMLSAFVDQSCVRWAQALNIFPAPSFVLGFVDFFVLVLGVAIWSTTTAFAVGFALRARKFDRIQWGASAALLVGTVYLWAKHPLGLTTLSHTAAVVAAVVLLSGLVGSFLLRNRARTHFFSNAVAVLVMTAPWFAAVVRSPRQPPDARRLWSVTLQKGTWQAMNTGSSFGATRQLVFCGERVVAVFDVGFPRYEGKQPISAYRLVSLDSKTGQIEDTREFSGRWGNIPYLFATNDGHVILDQGSLTILNPDLSDAGRKLNIGRGRVDAISPDGSTLAWETTRGTVLLDSHTLKPLGKPLKESVPRSVSTFGVITDNAYWYPEYPNDRAFVGLTDEHGLRLLFHGNCGEPEFLSNETILIFGCGKMRVINLQGAVLKEALLNGFANFAGASEDGRRFAMEFSDERGDPSILLYEYFIVFDSQNLEPVRTVQLSELPERQSWSALSADGRYFVAGNPDDLSLFQLP